LIKYFKKDFNDLSEKTRQDIRPRFDNVMTVLFGYELIDEKRWQ
jgi:hypothetical protein